MQAYIAYMECLGYIGSIPATVASVSVSAEVRLDSFGSFAAVPSSGNRKASLSTSRIASQAGVCLLGSSNWPNRIAPAELGLPCFEVEFVLLEIKPSYTVVGEVTQGAEGDGQLPRNGGPWSGLVRVFFTGQHVLWTEGALYPGFASLR